MVGCALGAAESRLGTSAGPASSQVHGHLVPSRNEREHHVLSSDNYSAVEQIQHAEEPPMRILIMEAFTD